MQDLNTTIGSFIQRWAILAADISNAAGTRLQALNLDAPLGPGKLADPEQTRASIVQLSEAADIVEACALALIKHAETSAGEFRHLTFLASPQLQRQLSERFEGRMLQGLQSEVEELREQALAFRSMARAAAVVDEHRSGIEIGAESVDFEDDDALAAYVDGVEAAQAALARAKEIRSTRQGLLAQRVHDLSRS